MKTDRELLELAAAAAGIGPVIGYAVQAGQLMIGPRNFMRYWAPLNDDGECARMEVACELQVDIGDIGVISERLDGTACFEKYDDHSGDKNQARRRASVRAAAAIGEQQNELSREA